MKFELTALCELVPPDVKSDAAGGVAAHLRFGAVGVVDAHFKGFASERADRHHAVGADAEVAVAEMLRRGPEIESWILVRLGDDEVIAEPVPFGKDHLSFLLMLSSRARATRRPSAMARTTSEAPLAVSPQQKM